MERRVLEFGGRRDVVAFADFGVLAGVLELHLADRLVLRESDQLRQFDQLRAAVWERRADRATDGFGDLVELAEDVFRLDLVAQVAKKILLARDTHEVRVGVPVAHVVERVFVAELLIAGLEIDARVVRFRGADVLVEVAVVDLDVRAAKRVDKADETPEVDVNNAVQAQFREDFALDRFGGQQTGL